MECNKYEAIRAREIAEKKMQQNDFVGARKLAVKAQQIYSDTENIIQLLTVCDVHCASQRKIDAFEMDWYGILQIAQTADDSLIKKQYRKLALLLHPDKNKFPGAEAAFKMIGEAHRLLSDPVKKRMHDMKRKTFVKPSAHQQPHSQYDAKQSFQSVNKAPPHMPQYVNVNLRQHQQPPAQQAYNSITFATQCLFCSTRLFASISDKNKIVSCSFCKKSFIAMEMQPENFSKEKNARKAAFVKKDVPIQGQSATDVKFKKNVQPGDIHTNGSTKATSGKGHLTKSKSTQDNNRKRKKAVEIESEPDSDSESDTDEDELFVVDDKIGNNSSIGTDGLRNPRRSTRQKHNISYDESRNDDDDLLSHCGAAKVSSVPESNNEGVKLNENECKSNHVDFEPVNNNIQNLKRVSPSEDVNNGLNSESLYSYPEPEFNNFDDIRKESCFEVGQIWALYDDVGAMPRFYGRVKNVYKSNKKLNLSWLERVLDDDMTQKSDDSLLQCSCGKYICGSTQIIDMDDGKFSHPVIWEKGSGRNTYCIYPRQGQVWALFKNWKANQASRSTSTKTFEYEYVEMLSHYVQGQGVTVAYLGKAKGYGSIFCRLKSDGKTDFIPQEEVVRFSHMIPSFRLIDGEREVYELDPASVPLNEEAIVDLGNLKVNPGNSKPSFDNGNDVASPKHSMDNCSGNASEDPDSHSSKSEQNDLPDSEFFSFESNRSADKFKVGQLWAVYCDDGLPKYYVQIQRIKSSSEFKLVAKWLDLCDAHGVKWLDTDMPAGCGTFSFSMKKPDDFTVAFFSHMMNWQPTGKKGEFAIFPAKGEVWALYKNWNLKMNFSDINNFQYDIAEILDIDELDVHVRPLHQVSGHVTVFRDQSDGEIQRIPKEQLLQFSHQIPAFLLTDELDGSLRGCWELDPAAIPPALLFTS